MVQSGSRNLSIPRSSVIVIRVLRSIATLMVKGNTKLVILCPVHARTTGERFLHLRLGAGAAGKVGIATTRGKCRGPSSEVVIRDDVQRRRAVTVVRGSSIAANTASRNVIGVTGARMEGRSI